MGWDGGGYQHFRTERAEHIRRAEAVQREVENFLKAGRWVLVVEAGGRDYKQCLRLFTCVRKT